MDKDMEARLSRLEEALAHQTRMVEDLSEVIARQDTEIARLTRRVALLMQSAADRELDAGGSIPLADQKPPHY